MSNKIEAEWDQPVNEGEFKAAEELKERTSKELSAVALTATSQLDTEAIIIQSVN